MMPRAMNFDMNGVAPNKQCAEREAPADLFGSEDWVVCGLDGDLLAVVDGRQMHIPKRRIGFPRGMDKACPAPIMPP